MFCPTAIFQHAFGFWFQTWKVSQSTADFCSLLTLPFQFFHFEASLLQFSPRIWLPIWLCGASCHQCWHCLPSDPWEIWWRWWHSGLFLPVKSGLQGKDIDSCLLIIRFTCHCTSYSVWMTLSWPLFTHSPVYLICVGLTSICSQSLWNIQELLEKANVPFVGTPSKECQRAFDKVHCMFLSRLLLTRYVINFSLPSFYVIAYLDASPLFFFATVPWHVLQLGYINTRD